MNNKVFGRKGEQLAALYLKSLRYHIIEHNWRYQHLEVDLIALDEEELVFIEVKTRKNELHGNPEHAISLAKKNHLVRAAEFYLEQSNSNRELRFDFVSVIHNEEFTNIEHFKDAFWLGVY
ncbi:MAG: YraN family protein [Bacteroidia bacterium]